MNKERLEEIKNNKTYLEGTNELIIAINTDDYDWLTEQAERVQDLENSIRLLDYSTREMIRHLEEKDKFISGLEKKNKRYREAREIIEQVYKDSFVMGACGYENGFTDGLDTALDIIDETLEGEE